MKKWKTFEHNGILFPPLYDPQRLSIGIRGRVVRLNPLQEEMAYLWSKKKDTPYAQDRTFQKNFTRDFARALDSEFGNIVYDDLDFSEIYRIVDAEKARKEMMGKEERKSLAAKRKELREKMKEKYGWAVMNGSRVEVGNYMAEPPGIFIGRGDHPLRGKWKRRVTSRDVTLNLGKHAPVPPGDWGKIIHDPDSMWLASWDDELTDKRKYVWLADTAGLKQERDKAKYDKAITLGKQIEKIRKRMIRDLKSNDPRLNKIATACYLIYRTAMRVGDEKDKDEADTVGATTLRKEHITISDDSIEFDFLGKDSVRWKKSMPATGDDIQFRDNLRALVRDKKPSEEIFDGITSRHVNAYYSGIVAGLTAKVFRTYLASTVVRNYLKKYDSIETKSIHEKLYRAKLANLEAAKMCNHKRTIPKTFANSLAKKRETLKKTRSKPTKTEKQKQKKKERIEKIKLQIDLAEKTRDYNLGTSLRNYIDPRIIKSWVDKMDAPWTKLYTASLQKKFLWVQNEKTAWTEMAKQ